MTKIQFNKEQQMAVEKVDGAYGVIASAGAGKTTILLGRIKNLVEKHKIFEKDILAISFTRNTADELISELGSMGLNHVNVGTFHSICGQILSREGININRSMVQEWQVDNCFKRIDQTADTKDILNFISYQKNYLRSYDDDFVKKDSYYTEMELRKFFKAYEDMKKKQNMYDFDDYLILCLEILKDNPDKYTFDYILVDEHQDSNKVQNLLLEEWSKTGNIFTLSDYRQAIYSFRGGTTEYSMNFDKYWDNAEIMNVHINYRSPKNVVNNANDFIKKYYGTYEHYVDAVSHSQEDGHIETNSYSARATEAEGVVDRIQKLIDNGTEPKDITVLYRNNKHADYIENQLKLREIDYDIANNGSFFKRREIAGILSFLRLIQDTEDNNAFEGVFRLRTDPLKYFSNAIFGNIQSHANKEDVSLFMAMQRVRYPQTWHMKNVISFRNGINRLKMQLNGGVSVVNLIDNIVSTFKIREMINEKYTHKPERDERLESIGVLKSFVRGNDLDQFISYVYSNNEQQKKKENAVQLMTIHRSKGLEFDNVFVVGIEDGEFPSQREGAMNDIVEEARLMYVAVTRSKKNLWISEIGQGNLFLEEYGYEDKKNDNKSIEVEHDVEQSIKEKMGLI